MHTENVENKQTEDAGKVDTIGMTPAELFRYHLLNPEEPITDEEIKYAKISDDVVVNEQQNTADTDAEMREEDSEKEERTNPIHTPYDVMGS